MNNSLTESILALQNGEVVAFPTETVYGLGASAFNPDAIAKIYLVKGRPSDNPLIVHISDLEMLGRVAINIPPILEKLAKAFWPGPLTVILQRHPQLPSVVSAGLETVAVRMPMHPIAQELIRGVGPIAAPSANLSGKPSSTTAEHVKADFEGKIAAIIDGGPSQIGIESTVISLLEKPYVVLRPGSISKEELEDILGESIRLRDAHDRHLSPGMKYRHYAPKARVCITRDSSNVSGDMVLSREPISGVKWHPLEASTLYAHFREADRLGFAEICVLLDSRSESDLALMDRLQKAAAG
jgi:L-threonylcarbamoyladenylate synthase